VLTGGGGWLVKMSDARVVFEMVEMRPEDDGAVGTSLQRRDKKVAGSVRFFTVAYQGGQLDTRTGFPGWLLEVGS
jgi:hypothetical protein